MPFLHLEAAAWKPPNPSQEQAIAALRGDKASEKVLWLNTSDSFSGAQVIKLKETGYFQVLPNPNPKKRDVIFLTGTSGSGKSYFAKNFILDYVKLHNNQRKVFIVSQMESDETLDEAMYLFPSNISESERAAMAPEAKEKYRNPMVKRIPLDDNYWFENPPSVDHEHFARTLWVFDDIDAIPNKQMVANIEMFLNNIATRGRMHGETQGAISTLYITHHTSVGTNKRLKLVMHDSTGYVVYPSSSSARGLVYLLNNYANVDCNFKILNQKFKRLGRWVYIRKHYPQVMVSANQAELVCKNEDEMMESDEERQEAIASRKRKRKKLKKRKRLLALAKSKKRKLLKQSKSNKKRKFDEFV